MAYQKNKHDIGITDVGSAGATTVVVFFHKITI